MGNVSVNDVGPAPNAVKGSFVVSASVVSSRASNTVTTNTDLRAPDNDRPARTHELDLLGRVLSGKLYDVLSKEFHEERGANSEYIPLRQRKPSVRYNLCRTVVEDSR